MVILELKEHTYGHSGIKGSTLIAILELREYTKVHSGIREHNNGHSGIKGIHQWPFWS